MKENQNKNYLFWEEWNADYAFIRHCESKQYAQLLRGIRAEMTVNAAEWVKDNPQPPVRRDTFIRQLHDRLSALEAALAEKGGSR